MQALLQMRMEGEQELHVFRRVSDLIGRERTSAPIGKCMCFREFGAMDPLHQIGISDLGAESQHGGGNLGIEKRLGNLASVQRKQIEILAACMDDLFHVRIADQFPKRSQRAVGLDGWKINDGRNVLSGHLNEFQFWNEAVFADEFRIQAQPPARP